MNNFCGRVLLAENGAVRGACIRLKRHIGRCATGRLTCLKCATELTLENSAPSMVRRGGYCTKCNTRHNRKIRGTKPRNSQSAEQQHTFPCGCSGILPKVGESNRFARFQSRRTPIKPAWVCRVSAIVNGIEVQSRKGRYVSIAKDVSHDLIRSMMDKPCYICDSPLDWDEHLKSGRAPALHHDHDTGEAYGFVHSHCNRRELEVVICKLRAQIRELKCQDLK